MEEVKKIKVLGMSGTFIVISSFLFLLYQFMQLENKLTTINNRSMLERYVIMELGMRNLHFSEGHDITDPDSPPTFCPQCAKELGEYGDMTIPGYHMWLQRHLEGVDSEP